MTRLYEHAAVEKIWLYEAWYLVHYYYDYYYYDHIDMDIVRHDADVVIDHLNLTANSLQLGGNDAD